MKKGTWILLALVVATVGYALFDVKWTEKQEKQKSEAAKLLSLPKESIESIEFSRGDSSFRLEKKDGEWKVVSPVVESADAKAVADFLDGLALEKSQREMREGSDLKVFGLDEPTGTLKLAAKEKTETFQVGKNKNFQGEPYLLKLEDKKIFLAEASWNTKFEKDLLSFRDGRWMNSNSTDVDAMQVKNLKGVLHLEKKDSKWKFADQQWTFDVAKWTPMLSDLNTSKILSVEAEDLKMTKKLNLGSPQVSLSVNLPGDKKWKADLHWVGKAGSQKVYLVDQGRGKVFSVDPETARKYLELTADGLRDRTEAFAFDRAQAQKASVIVGQKSFDLEPAQVTDLVQKIQNLKVADFLNRAPTKKDLFLKKVELKKSDGTSLFSLEMGPSVKKGSENLVAVKTSLFPELVAVPQASLDALKLNDLEKKDEVPQKSEKM